MQQQKLLKVTVIFNSLPSCNLEIILIIRLLKFLFFFWKVLVFILYIISKSKITILLVIFAHFGFFLRSSIPLSSSSHDLNFRLINPKLFSFDVLLLSSFNILLNCFLFFLKHVFSHFAWFMFYILKLASILLLEL